MTGRRSGTPASRPARPAGGRAAVRRGGGARRARGVRRASAGLTPVRAGALLVLLAGVAGLYGLSASSAFTVHRTEVRGATWTSEGAILTALAVPAGQNVFTVNSAQLAGRLDAIPAVRSARVSVSLPDAISVVVDERQALVMWQAGDRRFLVDGTGLLFGEVADAPPAAAASLPVVDDSRAAAASLGVGAMLDPVVLDAALRLGSLTPADLGSTATSLRIRLDDSDGFTVDAVPTGWSAVFGFYTPTLRTTDLIPGQVRLLRSLLYGREATVGRIILADDRSGTYLPRSSATPIPKSTPRSTPKPTPKPTAKPTTRPASPSASTKPGPTPAPSATAKP